MIGIEVCFMDTVQHAIGDLQMLSLEDFEEKASV